MLFQFTFFQIILIIVAVLFLANGLWKFIKREQNQTFFKVVYTTFVWGGILFLALFPDLPRELSIRFGLGETLNVLIFFGFVLVFMAIFKLLSSIERLEQTISEVIRKQALKDVDKYIDKK
jgi:hypothetical protein